MYRWLTTSDVQVLNIPFILSILSDLKAGHRRFGFRRPRAGRESQCLDVPPAAVTVMCDIGESGLAPCQWRSPALMCTTSPTLISRMDAQPPWELPMQTILINLNFASGNWQAVSPPLSLFRASLKGTQSLPSFDGQPEPLTGTGIRGLLRGDGFHD